VHVAEHAPTPNDRSSGVGLALIHRVGAGAGPAGDDQRCEQQHEEEPADAHGSPWNVESLDEPEPPDDPPPLLPPPTELPEGREVVGAVGLKVGSLELAGAADAADAAGGEADGVVDGEEPATARRRAR
jgi:hypothetical protein